MRRGGHGGTWNEREGQTASGVRQIALPVDELELVEALLFGQPLQLGVAVGQDLVQFQQHLLGVAAADAAGGAEGRFGRRRRRRREAERPQGAGVALDALQNATRDAVGR